jgi:hypothetical protein
MKNLKIDKTKFFEYLMSTKGMVTAIISLIVFIALIVTMIVFIINANNQKPKPLSAPNITVEQKTIKWGFVSGAQKYIVYVDDVEYARTDYNQFYIGGLQLGTYKFSVASSRGDEVSAKSNEITLVLNGN